MGEAKPSHSPGAVGRARYLRREMTFAERKLWERLRKLQANVRRQAPIGRYIADFVSHSSRLIIEVDGPLHDTLEAQAHDAARTAWLNSQGYRVIRFSGREVVESTEQVVAQVKALLSPGECAPPFPLDGGRVGDGGDSLSAEGAVVRTSQRGVSSFSSMNTERADALSPPSQPFPHQGGRASGVERV
jgi:very-short-patch-repair endonuclease